jgi:hypothetical protein
VLASFTEAQVAELFTDAVTAGIEDCQNSRLLALLPYVDADLSATRQMLFSWLPLISSDPRNFVAVYSGKVLATDRNARQFLATLPQTETETASSSRGLAQYLLRTNVALELSEQFPYHPHSHRVDFVSEKLLTVARQSVSLNLDLLRQTEIEAATALAREIPSLALESDLPLVLAVVLSGAHNTADIIPLTLKLRRSRSAKRYRRWMSELQRATRSRDFHARLNALRNLNDARSSLAHELSKLYSRRRLIPKAVQTYVDVIDIKGDDLKDLLNQPTLAKKVVGDISAHWNWRSWRAKRKITVLLSLAKDKPLVALNDLLGRVFGRGLSAEELEKLQFLRATQRDRATRLRGALT